MNKEKKLLQEAMTAILAAHGFVRAGENSFRKPHPEYPHTTTFFARFTDDGSVYHKEVIYYDSRRYTVRNEFTAHTLDALIKGLA